MKTIRFSTLIPRKISSNFRGWPIHRKNGNTTLILQKISHNFTRGQEPVCILQRAKSILHYASCIVYDTRCTRHDRWYTMHHADDTMYCMRYILHDVSAYCVVCIVSDIRYIDRAHRIQYILYDAWRMSDLSRVLSHFIVLCRVDSTILLYYLIL